MSSHPHVEQFSHPPSSYRKQNCFLYTDWEDVDDSEAGKEARSRLKCWKRQAETLQKARISRVSLIWETVTDQLGQTLCFHLPYFLENQIWGRSNKKCHLCVIWLWHIYLCYALALQNNGCWSTFQQPSMISETCWVKSPLLNGAGFTPAAPRENYLWPSENWIYRQKRKTIHFLNKLLSLIR